MPKRLLDQVEVAGRAVEARRVGVSKRVAAVAADARALAPNREPALRLSLAQPRSTIGREQRPGASIDVSGKQLDQFAPQQHDVGPVALRGADAKLGAIEINVLGVKGDRGADAQPIERSAGCIAAARPSIAAQTVFP